MSETVEPWRRLRVLRPNAEMNDPHAPMVDLAVRTLGRGETEACLASHTGGPIFALEDDRINAAGGWPRVASEIERRTMMADGGTRALRALFRRRFFLPINRPDIADAWILDGRGQATRVW